MNAPTTSSLATQRILELQHFIGGRSVPASSGEVFDVQSPVTEQVIATSAKGTVGDVDAAVAAARAQFDGGAWRRMNGSQRGVLLNRLADLAARDAERIADMDAGCIGRVPIEPRLLDLPNAIETLRHAAGWADKIEGRTIPTPGYMGHPTLSYTMRGKRTRRVKTALSDSAPRQPPRIPPQVGR